MSIVISAEAMILPTIAMAVSVAVVALVFEFDAWILASAI